ncbi:hypothetical protein [Methylobacterium radiotolerans]|uniref:hypothetical protein n=1 Tax=Methylobacterium radiotolerans TaxID=31998 RepID=UPI00059C6E1D|nr:hypothetical protein [Methylobacterium radiotolerans]
MELKSIVLGLFAVLVVLYLLLIPMMHVAVKRGLMTQQQFRRRLLLNSLVVLMVAITIQAAASI